MNKVEIQSEFNTQCYQGCELHGLICVLRILQPRRLSAFYIQGFEVCSYFPDIVLIGLCVLDTTRMCVEAAWPTTLLA